MGTIVPEIPFRKLVLKGRWQRAKMRSNIASLIDSNLMSCAFKIPKRNGRVWIVMAISSWLPTITTNAT